MKLSIITDEVSQDPLVAIKYAVAQGIRHVAVRSIWGKNILQCDDQDVERLAELFRRHDLAVTSIMSPLFKCLPIDTPGPHLVDPHFVGFPPILSNHIDAAARLPALAAAFQAPTVRIFTFLTAEPIAATLTAPQIDSITQAVEGWPARLAAVENEYFCYVRTLPELERFTALAGLSAVVDPCNSYLAAGSDGLDELSEELLARTVDLHVKDRQDGRYVPVGDGTLRWPQIFDRLNGLGYSGTVTLESHLRGDLDGLDRSIAALRKWVTP
ncbi:sugar phosphate isomerase/epimerase family protein [Kitasatospora sp. NBC_01266]|uniref:sugar phosphate isomerase/epimerase family protein n=1 Tax=Kitasatospora sp. NBC_01266 TaxID=2903572 RepID=UPI002E367B57|nr:sugar phosphate isomerase/epimerase [Kitasatospora sp. NBC_01266]